MLIIDVMEYMKELTQYQERNGLQISEMAKAFGVEWQIYKNWLNRNSLPKKYINRANEILIGDKPEGIIKQINAKLSSLSPESLEAALKSVEVIHDLEKR